jgi:ATP-dependent DNA helicase DinG
MTRASSYDMHEIFGADGLLASAIPGFAARREQIEMAELVSEALTEKKWQVIEAATGVGKTFAYLAPALLGKRRVLISTGTRSLQDQLFLRDLPVVARALGRPARVAILKGRANYLCLHRLATAYEQGTMRGFKRESALALATVKEWSWVTRRGDIAELTKLGEQDPVWPWVTSNRENCLGTECSEFSRCHLVAARREAQAADIVVINHHLLMADLLLKEGGFGDLLPGADAIIVDEAHQLPEVAAQAFGIAVSARQLQTFARDLAGEALHAGLRHDGFDVCVQTLERVVADAQDALRSAPEHLVFSSWPTPFIDALADLVTQLEQIAAKLSAVTGDSASLKSMLQRVQELIERLQMLMSSEASQAGVRWVQVGKHGFSVHFSPVQAAAQLRELIERHGGAWIFTSATLAVGDDFSHFTHRIGLEDAACARLGSPFDYPRQALLYLPAKLDEPSSAQHTAQVVDAAVPVLEASGGRAFLLFTSHRALKSAAAILRERWGERPPYPLLIQGEAPRDVLLKRFREFGNAVLLGTGSFWEGVDVKGTALAVVVVDKLPFAVPDTPVLKARLDAIQARGGNPFFEEQIPQAVVALKQGVGRLIRDANDFGVVMICDRRLTSRGYGKIFLDSLPPMPRTRDLEHVCKFLRDKLAAHGHVEAWISP